MHTMTATATQNQSAGAGVSAHVDPPVSVAETATGMPSRSAVRDGALAMLPLLAAYVPFALVIGSAVAEHGSPLAGWTGSWLIYGGSAHLATLRTLDNAGAVAAILTGLLINARLLVYSASLARRWGEQPRWFRVVAAGLIIDPTWAAAERHADQCADPPRQRQFFLAAGLTLGAGWSAAIAVGALMGARLDGLDLEIVIPLCLLGLVGPGLRAAGARSVIVVAAVVALITTSWPAGTGILGAVVAGCAAGLASERRSRS
jgi:predicted branched-subunit amino acid permease